MSAIVAILNTYSLASGANIAQVVIRSDGSVQIFGDDAMGRHAIGKLVNATLPAPAPVAAPRFIKPIRRGFAHPAKARTCRV